MANGIHFPCPDDLHPVNNDTLGLLYIFGRWARIACLHLPYAAFGHANAQIDEIAGKPKTLGEKKAQQEETEKSTKVDESSNSGTLSTEGKDNERGAATTTTTDQKIPTTPFF